MEESARNIITFFNSIPNYVGKGLLNLAAAVVGGIFIAWLTSTLFARKSQIAETEGELLRKKISIYEELASKLEAMRNMTSFNMSCQSAIGKMLEKIGLNTSNLAHRSVITIFTDPKKFTTEYLSIDKYLASHRIFFDDKVLLSTMILQNYLATIRRIQVLYEEQILAVDTSLDDPKSVCFGTNLMVELGVLIESEFSGFIDDVLEAIRVSLDNLDLRHHKSIPHTEEYFSEKGPVLKPLMDTILFKGKEHIMMLVTTNVALALASIGKKPHNV